MIAVILQIQGFTRLYSNKKRCRSVEGECSESNGCQDTQTHRTRSKGETTKAAFVGREFSKALPTYRTMSAKEKAETTTDKKRPIQGRKTASELVQNERIYSAVELHLSAVLTWANHSVRKPSVNESVTLS
jgi:hypothetical protein